MILKERRRSLIHFKALSDCHDQVTKLFEQKRIELKDMVHKKFESLYAMVMIQEIGILRELDTHLNYQQHQWDKKFGTSSKIWQNLDGHILDHCGGITKNRKLWDWIHWEFPKTADELTKIREDFSKDFELESAKIASILQEALSVKDLLTNSSIKDTQRETKLPSNSFSRGRAGLC